MPTRSGASCSCSGWTHTPATTPSDNLHGMSAALVAGEPGMEAVFGDEPRAPLQPRHLHMFGIRSMDRGERELLPLRGINMTDTAGEFAEPDWMGRERWHCQFGRSGIRA